ncbi:MAG: energy transducer TonB [Bacteroidia bacterium]|nr:energy transducer TonB [Bacteroidia bacterium]
MKIVCRSNKKFTNYDNNLIFVITPDSLYFGDNANNFLSKVSERRKEELIKNNSLVGESARSDTKTIKEKVRKNEFISESDKNKINSDNYEEVPPPPPPVFEEEEEEEPIYFIAVEKMPEPIGGISAIQKKVVYPELAKRAGVQGRVYVKAFVDNNGIVRKVEIIKGIGAGCDEAAMKAVQDTKFNPGQQRGRNVNVQVNIPIIFGLK